MTQLENQGPGQQRAKPGWRKRKPRSKKLLRTLLCMAVLLTFIIVAATSCGGSNQTASSTTEATTTLATIVTSSTLAATASTGQETTNMTTAEGTYSDGIYLVGTAIPPGIYKGTVKTDQGYWGISSDPKGENIITAANPTGQFYVQVETGQYLTLAGVTIAKEKLSRPVNLPSKASADGTYLVGVDIAAGTYQGTVNGDSGDWTISSDPNGDNVISNASETSPFSIQVTTGQYLTLSNVTISR
jgi:hypothetical protein